MRISCLVAVAALVCSCKPGQSFKLPDLQKDSNNFKPSSDRETVPSGAEGVQTPPPDPEEESKAMEPAIIGGAYLYCDADAPKSDDTAKSLMKVGCLVGNVSSSDWAAANKNVQIQNMADGAMVSDSLVLSPAGSPYQMVFESERGQQANLEMRVTLSLPQGSLELSSTVSPYNEKLSTLRQAKGISLITSTGSAGVFSGIDHKSWNLWMPIKIPKFITNIVPYGSSDSSSNWSGSGSSSWSSSGFKLDDSSSTAPASTIELSFDDTVCTYQTGNVSSSRYNDGWSSEARAEDFKFVSCTRSMWLPDQWVRSKNISLRIIRNANDAAPRMVGVVLETSL